MARGFSKVYENALAHELRKQGFRIAQQNPAPVIYDGIVVGDFVVDLLVENRVLVELKADKSLENTHMAQCLNYLRATGLKICLLLNFGEQKLGIKRLVL